MPTLILTQAQAQAVYSAMCALNNVGGSASALWCKFPMADGRWAGVRQDDSGGVHIGAGPLRRFSDIESMVIREGKCEVYGGQSAFASAYGLDQGGAA